MVLLLDDDDKVLEATMSFIDEFSFDESATPAVESATSKAPIQQMQCQMDVVVTAPIVDSMDIVQLFRVDSGVTPKSIASCKRLDTAGMTKREKIIARNARKKLLRKAGIYGDSNRVRNERKLEIAYLRERIENPHIDLNTLKTHKVVHRDASVEKSALKDKGQQATSNALVVLDSTWKMSSVWQEIADRQQRRRKEAERENIRLKLAMERQRKVANTLSSLLQKRISQLENDCSFFASQNCPKHQTVHVLDYRGEINSFQGLFQHVEAAYRDIDAVFAANGLADMVFTPNDVHVSEDAGGRYLELFSNKVLPFNLHDATEAAWNHFKGTDKHMGNGSIYEKKAKNLDDPYMIIEEFTKEVYSNSSRADVKMQQVVRRFVEADRDIVIWVASVVPTEIKHKIIHGLTYRIRGYALTKRSSASTPDQELSQLQFCYLISLDQDIGTRYHSDNMRALVNFLIVNTAQNMRVHHSYIENSLIDQACKPH